MTRSLLVLGGARSGKSRYAQGRIEALPVGRTGRLAYLATAQAFDAEMAERIARHRQDRGSRWMTVEEPLDLSAAIGRGSLEADAVLVDCLTLWLSNLMLGERRLEGLVEELCGLLAAPPCPVVLVSNEVGLSIVPEHALARRFRDEAGRLNQRVAATVDEVQFIAAGLPLKLK